MLSDTGEMVTGCKVFSKGEYSYTYEGQFTTIYSDTILVSFISYKDTIITNYHPGDTIRIQPK